MSYILGENMFIYSEFWIDKIWCGTVDLESSLHITIDQVAIIGDESYIFEGYEAGIAHKIPQIKNPWIIQCPINFLYQ